MEKNIIRKEIAALINSIKEHSDNIGDKKHVPQLELELILSKIKKLFEKSIIFNHLNSLTEEKIIIKSNDNLAEFSNSGKVEPIFSSPPKQEIKQEPTKPVENIDKPIDLFGTELPPVPEKQKVEKKVEKREEKQPAGKIQKPAISDISKAIGLNDKFIFANELFAGNMQEYSIAIHQLNSSESLQSALDYFGDLVQLYEWDSENQTVKGLLELVDRRYS